LVLSIFQFAKNSSLCLDTVAFIYYFQSHPRYISFLSKLFNAFQEGKFNLICSTISLSELLVKPLQEGNP